MSTARYLIDVSAAFKIVGSTGLSEPRQQARELPHAMPACQVDIKQKESTP